VDLDRPGTLQSSIRERPAGVFINISALCR
jgi:hypothetical protein